MAKCPACKTELLGYNWTTTKNNKKWLADAKGNWHDCPANKSKFSNSKYEKRIPLTDKDFDFCDMCGHSCIKQSTFEKYPQLSGLILEEHVQQFHPNGEILDDIDFMALSDEDKNKMRKRWNKPKRTILYTKINKIVR